MKRLRPIVMMSSMLLMSLTACVIHVGPGPDGYAPAHSAAGVDASLVLATSRVEGELLEVRDSAMVIVTRDRVVLVPFSAIDSGTFVDSPVTVGHREKPLSEDFQSIRLLSRYPQGIPAEALRRILADKGQDGLVFLR